MTQKIGVLALQGSFAEHGKMLEKLKKEFIWVRTKDSLEGLTHLIIPGGESTTMMRLLKMFEMWELLEKMVQSGKLKILGTCAGAILCERFGMNTKIDRNAYGSQLSSFVDTLDSEKFSDLEGVFIRAPKFLSVGENCKVLATYQKEPVLVEESNFLAMTFHPEISGNLEVYEYFLREVE